MQRTEPRVSDHAVVRWLERVHGIDVDAIRREILTDELRTVIEHIPNGRFPVGDKLWAVVRESCIVSIVPKRRRH